PLASPLLLYMPGHTSQLHPLSLHDALPICRFKHGGIDVRMEQHIARTARPAAIATVDALAAYVYPVGVRHAYAHARARNQVRNQAHRGCLAIGARDSHQWNAAVLALGEHAVDNGVAHGTALAERRAQVHAQSGRRIDFDDAATLLVQWFVDVFADQIDAANIQPDHLRRR